MSLSSNIASLVQSISSTIPTTTPDATIGVDIPFATTDLSSILTITSTAIVTAATTMAGPEDDHGGEGECRLLGPFALFVQLALGGLALLSLVYKRWRERPQRPMKIWFFDVSKQVFGSVLVHIANVFMSMLTSGRFSIKLDPAAVQAAGRLLRRDEDSYVPNPCSFYLLNLAIDVSLLPYLCHEIGSTEPNSETDYSRHSDSHPPAPRRHCSGSLYTMGKAAGVNSVWQLR